MGSTVLLRGMEEHGCSILVYRLAGAVGVVGSAWVVGGEALVSGANGLHGGGMDMAGNGGCAENGGDGCGHDYGYGPESESVRMGPALGG